MYLSDIHIFYLSINVFVMHTHTHTQLSPTCIYVYHIYTYTQRETHAQTYTPVEEALCVEMKELHSKVHALELTSRHGQVARSSRTYMSPICQYVCLPMCVCVYVYTYILRVGLRVGPVATSTASKLTIRSLAEGEGSEPGMAPSIGSGCCLPPTLPAESQS